MELTAEEINLIEKNREKDKHKKVSCPTGIGIGRIFYKAKIENRKFIDECTFIEKEGRA